MLQVGVDLRIWVREGLGQGPPCRREAASWPEEHRDWLAECAVIVEMDMVLRLADAEQQAFAFV